MKIHFKSIPVILFLAIIGGHHSSAQNLPSLLNERNINATFSILAFDEKDQEWGIAVATDNIYVGSSTIYIEPGVGAFSVIAETNPDYAHNGFNHLKDGKSIKEAILATKSADPEAHYRQVSGIDKDGNTFAFTGEALKFWNGYSNHIIGEGYVVMGNQLSEKALKNMAHSFENSRGPLAERLLKSLIAGQLAGGQVSGKQSAALQVKGTNNEWYNQIDLRVDHAEHPIADLETLLNYHYGRIRLNQAMYAKRAGNLSRAKGKLKEAETLLLGWDGMYGRIAMVNSILGDDEKAVSWIKKALLKNPQWVINLPAFYYLHQHSELTHLLEPASFTTKDWENAIQMLLRLDRSEEAISLSKQVLNQNHNSSYLFYLLGSAYEQNDEKELALENLEKALELNPQNAEARLLLEKIK